MSALCLEREAGKKRPSAKTAAPAGGVAVRSAGSLGWIDGFGSLAVPGFGPLVAAGPIAAALGGARTGGVAAGLIDFGVPQQEARRYEGRIKDGQILLSVHTENPDKSDRAREIFVASGAEEICTMMTVITPKILSRFAHRAPRPALA